MRQLSLDQLWRGLRMMLFVCYRSMYTVQYLFASMRPVFYAPVFRPILSSGMNVRARWQCQHGRCGTIRVRRAADLPPAAAGIGDSCFPRVRLRLQGLANLRKQRDLVIVYSLWNVKRIVMHRHRRSFRRPFHDGTNECASDV